ncbi:hypothetical protein LWI29_038477 [Acer saccharum]|uniref:Uncharacterized protein n=1 Tax=Acer saccharum TaxID=4024 RepID=A0AA39W5B9_ACESA|nr:hypothetical protein LWI29_038477 [Acer saccharum]
MASNLADEELVYHRSTTVASRRTHGRRLAGRATRGNSTATQRRGIGQLVGTARQTSIATTTCAPSWWRTFNLHFGLLRWDLLCRNRWLIFNVHTGFLRRDLLYRNRWRIFKIRTGFLLYGQSRFKGGLEVELEPSPIGKSQV